MNSKLCALLLLLLPTLQAMESKEQKRNQQYPQEFRPTRKQWEAFIKTLEVSTMEGLSPEQSDMLIDEQAKVEEREESKLQLILLRKKYGPLVDKFRSYCRESAQRSPSKNSTTSLNSSSPTESAPYTDSEKDYSPQESRIIDNSSVSSNSNASDFNQTSAQGTQKKRN